MFLWVYLLEMSGGVASWTPPKLKLKLLSRSRDGAPGHALSEQKVCGQWFVKHQENNQE